MHTGKWLLQLATAAKVLSGLDFTGQDAHFHSFPSSITCEMLPCLSVHMFFFLFLQTTFSLEFVYTLP